MKKTRGLIGLISSVFAAAKAVNDVRSARGKGDKLLLANAVATVAVVLTGGALAVRDLRGDKESGQ
ncbi:hypothetical protein [Sciscionella sediminilitoris]|uniref:hypothetical protein n=1 Tax=Sciscionella sediminilitoris TaxID=1445613 RepID=UPI0004DF9E59|nr:hypothetical protein [Sciscionella sp. SE31]